MREDFNDVAKVILIEYGNCVINNWVFPIHLIDPRGHLDVDRSVTHVTHLMTFSPLFVQHQIIFL